MLGKVMFDIGFPGVFPPCVNGLKLVPFYLDENKEQAIFQSENCWEILLNCVRWRTQNWQTAQQLVSLKKKKRCEVEYPKRPGEELLAHKWGGVICLVISKCICHVSAVTVQFSPINTSPRARPILHKQTKKISIAAAIRVIRRDHLLKGLFYVSLV